MGDTHDMIPNQPNLFSFSSVFFLCEWGSLYCLCQHQNFSEWIIGVWYISLFLFPLSLSSLSFSSVYFVNVAGDQNPSSPASRWPGANHGNTTNLCVCSLTLNLLLCCTVLHHLYSWLCNSYGFFSLLLNQSWCTLWQTPTLIHNLSDYFCGDSQLGYIVLSCFGLI